MIHKLKIMPEYFEKVISDAKTFELRHNDRGFKKGDYLALNEFDDGQCTGRFCIVYVNYILQDFTGLMPGYVVMSIKRCILEVKE